MDHLDAVVQLCNDDSNSVKMDQGGRIQQAIDRLDHFSPALTTLVQGFVEDD